MSRACGLWISCSAQNNSWKLVSHSLKVGTLLLAYPLEMYNKICPTKMGLFSHVLKWVRK